MTLSEIKNTNLSTGEIQEQISLISAQIENEKSGTMREYLIDKIYALKNKQK